MPASSKGSEHYIQLDRLELLETEVPLFIEQIRGTAPEPSDYGSKQPATALESILQQHRQKL